MAMSHRSRWVVAVAMALALGGPRALPVAAAVWCVDARNTSGRADGSAVWPFASIQRAVDAAAAGDEVAVAVGRYREAVRVNGKGVRLLGGFAGAAAYAGEPGDFSTRSADPAATWVEGTAASAVVHFTDAPGSVLDGFRISGGARGVLVDGQAWPSVVEDVRLARLLVEDNGLPTEHGGGINALGRRITVAGCTVRGNVGANAAGIYLHHAEDALVEDNLVADNVGHGDHGGGLALNGSGIVRRNVFRGNRIGESLGYGWGGGVLVVERHAGVVLLQGNLYTGNFAPSAGGAVFVDEGAVATLDHEFIAGNRALAAGGGVYADAAWDGRRSTLVIQHCTIADNVADDWPGWGAGVFVQASDVTMSNSIVWRNLGREGTDDVTVVDGGTLATAYSLLTAPHPGMGNLAVDPLFANPAAGDYHLRSRAGRWDGVRRAWVRDEATSPAVDAGDPAANYAAEPQPNGGRVNLGCYGNTAEASRSVSGARRLGRRLVRP